MKTLQQKIDDCISRIDEASDRVSYYKKQGDESMVKWAQKKLASKNAYLKELMKIKASNQKNGWAV